MARTNAAQTSAHAEEVRCISALMTFLEEARRAKWRAEKRKGGEEKFLLDVVAGQFHGYRNAKRRPTHAAIFSRDKVLEICDYLELSRAEQAEALRVAGYRPPPDYPEGEDLQRAIALCTNILRDIHMPAYVLRPDWGIEAWNQYVLDLLSWSDTKAKRIKAEGKLNVLYLMFDRSEDGLYKMIDNWEEAVHRNIYGFKQTNVLAQHEDWYNGIFAYPPKKVHYAHSGDSAG